MKVIIKTNNDRGQAALEWHRREEDAFRERLLKTPKLFRGKAAKKFLKLKSEMKDNKEIISGVENNDEETKKRFLENVERAMLSNGALKGDWVVFFQNE